jgi:UDP-glucose 4-epimerase
MDSSSKLTGKTVLVTGATGFIGGHLVRRLQSIPDVTLVVLSRQARPREADDMVWIQLALQELAPKVWLEQNIPQIDYVFHLGAFIPKSSSNANKVNEVFESNLIGTRLLLETLPSFRRFIFASTVDVYGRRAFDGILNEDIRVEPADLYGASKLFCEHLVQVYAANQGFHYAILRYGHIFGSGEEGYRKLIPQLIRQVLEGDPPILHGDGSAERDYLHVHDAVEATLRAAVSDRATLGPVNIVRGQSQPIREVAEIIAKAVGYMGDIVYLKDKPAGHSLRFENSLMRQTLGIWPFVSLSDGLKEEIASFSTASRY